MRMQDGINIYEQGEKLVVYLRSPDSKYCVKKLELEGNEAAMFKDQRRFYLRGQNDKLDRVDRYECLANGVYSAKKHTRILELRSGEPSADQIEDEILALQRLLLKANIEKMAI